MRAYPSAAPVTTPSNKPRMQRICGLRSSAATKCISDVPGLAKQTSTPPESSVSQRASAPFISSHPLLEEYAAHVISNIDALATLKVSPAIRFT